MNIALVVFGVLGIILQFITRKQEEKEKVYCHSANAIFNNAINSCYWVLFSD